VLPAHPRPPRDYTAGQDTETASLRKDHVGRIKRRLLFPQSPPKLLP